MKVAILISTFNRKNLLEKTLKSLHESLQNVNFDVTVYVSNDASKDGTEEFLSGWKDNKIDRIVITSKINKGLRETLNIGLATVYAVSEIKGQIYSDPDYICYVQDDVEFKPGWLDACIKMWEQQKGLVGFITCHDAPEHPTVAIVNGNPFKKTCRATHLFASVERWKKFGVIPDLTPGIAAPKPGQGSLVDWWLVGHPKGKYPESEHSLKKDGEFVLVIPGYVKHIGVEESTWGNVMNPEF